MTPMIINAVLGAVLGFLGTKIPMIANHQSAITNALMGLVGGVGGGFAGNAVLNAGAPAELNAASIGAGVVGSLVAILAAKFLPAKSAE